MKERKKGGRKESRKKRKKEGKKKRKKSELQCYQFKKVCLL